MFSSRTSSRGEFVTQWRRAALASTSPSARLPHPPFPSNNADLLPHSAIANFSTIIGLIGALLGTFLCMQAMALMRLYDEARDVKAGRRRNWRLTSWCLFVLAVGTFITVAGVSLSSSQPRRCRTLADVLLVLFARLYRPMPRSSASSIFTKKIRVQLGAATTIQTRCSCCNVHLSFLGRRPARLLESARRGSLRGRATTFCRVKRIRSACKLEEKRPSI